jgi:ribonucleotide reductase alpha subunit
VESTEPVTSNMFSRRTLAGEFAVVNRYLVADLLERGLWSKDTKSAILAQDGSVQAVPGVPDDLKALYRTAWELSMKAVIDMAADRGAYVCQTQSMNLFVAEPTFKKLSSMHFYAWRRGLKTGQYYLRSRPAARAVQVTVPDCLACSA